MIFVLSLTCGIFAQISCMAAIYPGLFIGRHLRRCCKGTQLRNRFAAALYNDHSTPFGFTHQF